MPRNILTDFCHASLESLARLCALSMEEATGFRCSLRCCFHTESVDMPKMNCGLLICVFDCYARIENEKRERFNEFVNIALVVYAQEICGEKREIKAQF